MDSSKKCASCGSDELFFNEGYFQNAVANVFPKLTDVFHNTVEVDVYVCGQCGYVMFFMHKMHKTKLEQIRKKWAPIKQ